MRQQLLIITPLYMVRGACKPDIAQASLGSNVAKKVRIK